MYKNLKFKNLLSLNCHVKAPCHKNLFSLKCSIGSYFTAMKAQMKVQKKKSSQFQSVRFKEKQDHVFGNSIYEH